MSKLLPGRSRVAALPRRHHLHVARVDHELQSRRVTLAFPFLLGGRLLSADLGEKLTRRLGGGGRSHFRTRCPI